MAVLTGAAALVACLRRAGVRTVFGLPGVHNLPLYDALLDAPDLRHILARHEAGAAFMADGYARASGEAGVLFTITGPGLLNALTGIGEAYAASSPLLVVATEVPSPLKGKGVLHELPDQMGTVSSLTGWRRRVHAPGEVPEAFEEAWAYLQSGRPRPAYLEVPVDVLSAPCEMRWPEAGRKTPARPRKEDLRRAAGLLSRARRPLIIAGGGSVGAPEPLREMAERLRAPVLSTPTGKGALPEDHPLFLGNMWSNTWSRRRAVTAALEESDACLAVGTRFSGPATGDFALSLTPHLIQVDIDPSEVGKNYPVEVALVGDAKEVLRDLLRDLGGDARGEPMAPCWQPKEGEDPRPDPNALAVLQAIRSSLPRDAILAWDSLISLWAAIHFPAYQPRTFLLSSGLCTLGYALPAAIGAKAAFPRRPVAAVTGDGAFLFSLAELATLVQEGLPVTILLLNDGGYRAIRNAQEANFRGRTIACDLKNPDFVALAQSFGLQARRIEGVEEIEGALREALSEDGAPHLIELPLALASP